MPNVRACLVSFTDTERIRHTAEVSASSLFEAAALGVAEFKRCGLIDVHPGNATLLSVTVKSPTTTHEVSMSKLESWLTGGARSPKDHLVKKRLREISGIGERSG